MMPPKKRALEQSDSNAQPKRQAKQQKRDKAKRDTENTDKGKQSSEDDDHVSKTLSVLRRRL